MCKHQGTRGAGGRKERAKVGDWGYEVRKDLAKGRGGREGYKNNAGKYDEHRKEGHRSRAQMKRRVSGKLNMIRRGRRRDIIIADQGPCRAGWPLQHMKELVSC